MLESFRFGRLDSSSSFSRFIYDKKSGNDANWQYHHGIHGEAGAHVSMIIKNYLREDIFLVGSLRSEPQIFSSIYDNSQLHIGDTSDVVVIELRFRENAVDYGQKNRIKTQKTVRISCPGHYLQKYSLFIEELGCYITIRNRLAATQECIVHDSRGTSSVDVSVSPQSVKPDPVSTFRDFEQLVKNCLDRADNIQVRVGVRVDVSPSSIPSHIKDMRIAILDRDFSPYLSNKMTYDPTLLEDEFVVENLHFISSEPLVSTFGRLRKAEGRAFFIDTEEHKTMNGVLCSLAIFADPEARKEYLFRHKSEELYAELTNRLVNRTGSHAFKEKVSELESEINKLREQNENLTGTVTLERNHAKEYKRIIALHEDTIKRFKSDPEANMSYDIVTQEVENTRKKLDLDSDKIRFDAEELDLKKQQNKSANKVSQLKSISDILKSTWGILVILGGVVAAAIKLKNKLKLSAV